MSDDWVGASPGVASFLAIAAAEDATPEVHSSLCIAHCSAAEWINGTGLAGSLLMLTTTQVPKAKRGSSGTLGMSNESLFQDLTRQICISSFENMFHVQMPMIKHEHH